VLFRSYAKVLASEHGQRPAVVVATYQSGGRGRLGRTFFSPKGGLYLSVLLPMGFTLESAQLITSAASVAALEAIEHVSGKQCLIKWVNDLYWEGKKVCGILTEGVLGVESGSLSAVVVGIGINFCIPQAAFPEDLRPLRHRCMTVLIQCLPLLMQTPCIRVVHNLHALVSRLPDAPSCPCIAAALSYWAARLWFIRQAAFSAIAVGIDDDARLVVEMRMGCSMYSALQRSAFDLKSEFFFSV
jgi:BirA family biotin operon repressor/biotin-[acetyl-CoA-carboxylase] ligase